MELQEVPAVDNGVHQRGEIGGMGADPGAKLHEGRSDAEAAGKRDPAGHGDECGWAPREVDSRKRERATLRPTRTAEVGRRLRIRKSRFTEEQIVAALR